MADPGASATPASLPIAPTLGLAEAARRVWDVIAVGAGPAGASAARELARAGRSVLLVDKSSFPRYKVCGSCLNGRVLSALEAVGLGAMVEEAGGVVLDGLRLAAAGAEAALTLPGGAALGRERFDALLVRAAVQAGTEFLPRTRARLGVPGGPTGSFRPLALHHDGDTESARARLVLAADGLGAGLLPRAPAMTAPASRIGAGLIVDEAPGFYRAGCIHMACGRAGYVGLVRLEDGRLDVAAAFDPSTLRHLGGPARAATGVIAEVGWPVPAGLAAGLWRGTPGLTSRPERIGAERLFVLGDAAGYVEPFTGEGIAWALTSARALCPLALRAVERWDPGFPALWADLHRRALGPRRLCHATSRLLRSPLLTGVLVRLLANAPALAGPIVQALNRHPALP
ncbi:MAG: NAD(P)/FAD-dependent oxidoreductase [Gammaproteobacteria bacterium]